MDAGCTPDSYVDVGQERTDALRSPVPFQNGARFVSNGPAYHQASLVVRGVQAVKIRSSAVGSLDAFALGLDSPFVCVVPTTRVYGCPRPSRRRC